MHDLRILIKLAATAIGSRSTRKFYDRISPYYDRIFRHHLVHASRMSEELDKLLAKDSLVLDLACGTGAVAGRLKHRGFRVVGLDISLQSLIQLGRNEPEIAVVQASAAFLPFQPATFDAVTCLGAWRHFGSPEIILSEISRVLRPGGIFLVGYFPARLAGLWPVPSGMFGRTVAFLYSHLVHLLNYDDRLTGKNELCGLKEAFRNVRRIDSADGEYLILAEDAARADVAIIKVCNHKS